MSAQGRYERSTVDLYGVRSLIVDRCVDCGTLIGSREEHDRFHALEPVQEREMKC